MKFAKTKLAAAIVAATMTSAANAVVVVGGDNGWTVSFDGEINLFYNHIDVSTRVRTSLGGTAKVASNGGNRDSSHLQEGLLPAFFSFNVKSPTVNGLTGTGRISFAPDSSSAKGTFNDKAGTAIDMREVVANVDGSFGTISFGRTLGMFGRQAILKDQTLFGVGDPGGVDGGGTTLGRIGRGYIYPEFRTRFAWKAPAMNGFVLEVGMFDPQEPIASGAFQTSAPKFEGELTYATTFTGGSVNAWVDGTWEEMHFKSGAFNDSVTIDGVDVGGELNWNNFQVVGNYYTGDALGIDVKNSLLGTGGVGTAGTLTLSHGINCGVGDLKCHTADNDGFYVQGGYTFGGKTKVAGSYGESTQDGATAIAGTTTSFNRLENSMWTIGVYHDLTSWLKLIAEYNNGESTNHTPSGTVVGSGANDSRVAGTKTRVDFDVFSVGAFFLW